MDKLNVNSFCLDDALDIVKQRKYYEKGGKFHEGTREKDSRRGDGRVKKHVEGHESIFEEI